MDVPKRRPPKGVGGKPGRLIVYGRIVLQTVNKKPVLTVEDGDGQYEIITLRCPEHGESPRSSHWSNVDSLRDIIEDYQKRLGQLEELEGK